MSDGGGGGGGGAKGGGDGAGGDVVPEIASAAANHQQQPIRGIDQDDAPSNAAGDALTVADDQQQLEGAGVRGIVGAVGGEGGDTAGSTKREREEGEGEDVLGDHRASGKEDGLPSANRGEVREDVSEIVAAETGGGGGHIAGQGSGMSESVDSGGRSMSRKASVDSQTAAANMMGMMGGGDGKGREGPVTLDMAGSVDRKLLPPEKVGL